MLNYYITELIAKVIILLHVCISKRNNYFLNLSPGEPDSFFCNVSSFPCFSFFVLFFLTFCCTTLVWDVLSSFLSSTLVICISAFCLLFAAFPFFFIKKRGVVQMVLRLGGFFSSLRFTLLNVTQNKCSESSHQILVKTKIMKLIDKFVISHLPVYLLEACYVVRHRTTSLLDDISDAEFE